MRQFLIFICAVVAFCCLSCAPAEPSSTPTATINAYVEAARKNDVAALRSILSKGTLQMLEKDAQAQSTSVDELISRNAKTGAIDKAAPETRNEQINGNDATIETKNPRTGTWDKLYLTKEDGRWKIAQDKFVEEMMKGFDEPVTK